MGIVIKCYKFHQSVVRILSQRVISLEILKCTIIFYQNDYLISVVCRYDRSTGVFTLPSDGAGLYYFYVHVLVDAGEYAYFNLKRNNEILCSMKGDNNGNGDDNDTGTCAATVMLNEGKKYKSLN